MSKTGVFIAVLLTALLGGLAWALLGPASPAAQSGADQGEPLLTFRPSDVAEIRIRPDSQPVQSVIRYGNAWRLEIPRQTDGPMDAWPIDSAQVRALLTVLNSIRAVPGSAASDSDRYAVTLELVMATGETRTLALHESTVGGRRAVTVDDAEPVYIDQPLAEALLRPGPRAWRDARLLPSVGAETSRITIETPSNTIALARVRGVWRLREPIAAPADPNAVNDVLTALAGLEAMEWLDDSAAPANSSAVSSTSRITITLERDVRTLDANGEPVVETERDSVVLGGAADLSANARLAFIGPASTPAKVRSTAVDRLRINPTALISRQSVQASNSQIAAIVIHDAPTLASAGALRLNRGVEAWSTPGEATPSMNIAPTEMRAFLSLVSESRADVVRMATEDEPEGAIQLELIDFQGAPLERLSIDIKSNNSLVIRNDNIVREYALGEIPAFLQRLK